MYTSNPTIKLKNFTEMQKSPFRNSPAHRIQKENNRLKFKGG